MKLLQVVNQIQRNQVPKSIPVITNLTLRTIQSRFFATQAEMKLFNQLNLTKVEKDMQMFTTKKIIDDDVYNVFEKNGLTNSPESIYWTGEELNYNDLSNKVKFDFFVRDLKTVKKYFENKPFNVISTGCLIDKLIDVVESNLDDGKLQTIYKKDFDIYPFIRLINTLPDVWDLHCKTNSMLDEWCKLVPNIDPLEMKFKTDKVGNVAYKEKFFYKRPQEKAEA
ncbi:hypothetical protein KGF54_004626 [Candida jiufengensis]|uniref:uncharacterized protein n=1 Tax=Candida jiufengensis TaxID=497108 RepID=UPI002225396E|nr:uncharacterized protein KGF54_004626 [Candida jiufengensis]KAI5951552.1 hypothetical protein KGF54_004626 [Candida jiufengensis]